MDRSKPAQLLKDVGRRLAELRRSAGLTQAALAERLDVTSRYIQSVEAGRENLTLTSLEIVTVALGVTVQEAFAPPSSTARARPGRPKRL